jgi:hypothetical protein
MDNFMRHFRREAPGVWVCIEPVTLQLAQGRVQVAPGTRFTLGNTFMNVEVARLLDDQYSRSQSPREFDLRQAGP